MSDAKAGQIVTFYSFKGGVGRTMALANVGFLAAMNGRKVLMMDWDLEAPGLAYYYRGLTVPVVQERGGKGAPVPEKKGILNLACDWVSTARSASCVEDVDALVRRYEDGSAFVDCIVPLAAEHLPQHGTLHLIGVGSSRIASAENQSYEDTLAHFSWADLMEQDGGGLMISALRSWAKSNYDLILVDSRTGLSDVAGICTMQLPDTVALCFALNRQNIDGVAKVAGAIRAKRGDEVALSAVPMRIPTSQTFESSDARGHAMRELDRVGGLSRQRIQEDFQALGIATAESIPFYEILAPFLADDPQYDPLTLKYLRLTREFVAGKDLVVPDIAPEWAGQVRRRLQPRFVTEEYLEKLQEADSTRATEEILQLLEGVAESDPDTVDDDYIDVLVKTAFLIAEQADIDQEGTIYLSAIDVLRDLSSHDAERWGVTFARGISEYALGAVFPEYEVVIALREEADFVLSQGISIEARLLRANNLRELASLHEDEGASDEVLLTLDRIAPLIAALRQDQGALSPDQIEKLSIVEVDCHRMRGAILEEREQKEQALREYELASIILGRVTGDFSNIKFLTANIHAHLAGLKRGREAAHHAIISVKYGYSNPFSLKKLLDVVMDVGDNDLVSEFSGYAFDVIGKRFPPGLGVTQELVKLVPTLVSIFLESKNPAPALSGLGHWLESTAQRRRISDEFRVDLTEAAIAFVSAIETIGMNLANCPTVQALALGAPLPRVRPNRLSNDD